MKVKAPTARVSRARVQQVDVREIRLGEVQIDRLTLSNVRVKSSTGTATLRNVSIDVNLDLKLKWRVQVTVDLLFDELEFSWSDSTDLGPVRISIGFPDLQLPGLADFSLDIPSLPVDDVSAVVGPIRNLNLGSLIAEQIRAQNCRAPAAGFTVSGLNLGRTFMRGIDLPAAAVSTATVDRVSGGAVPIAQINIPNLALPSTSIPSLHSSNLDVTTSRVTQQLAAADLGVLTATLTIGATAHMRADELCIDNLQADASIGQITLENVLLPFEIFGITLADLGIETLDIPQVEVS